MKLLFLSTPVGALGSGLGGGVELTLANLARELIRRGHSILTIAPTGSVLAGVPIVEIAGKLQITAQSQGRDAVVTLPEDAVLAHLWHYAHRVQDEYDVLVNFAYDWLPFYLTPLFRRPIAHLVSMGSLTNAMDQVIGQVAEQFPGTIGVHSRVQAETFPFADRCQVLANGLDLSRYEFCPEPQNLLGWVGRIAPEKGLEDAIALAQSTQIPLHVWGAMPDLAYWETVRDSYPQAPVSYQGFVSTEALQQGLRQCRALVMTPKWVEAFGNVAIEALACGVPVIAYRRGGPIEIVQDGVTGYLVTPDRVEALVEAVGRLGAIDRQECRRQAEERFSMQAMGDRVEEWIGRIGAGR